VTEQWLIIVQCEHTSETTELPSISQMTDSIWTGISVAAGDKTKGSLVTVDMHWSSCTCLKLNLEFTVVGPKNN